MSIQRYPIPEDLKELRRWIAVLFDSVTYSDSYGVEGSSFSVCRWCGGGSGPGPSAPFKHNRDCIFDNDDLEKRVQGAWEEVPELEAQVAKLESEKADHEREVAELKATITKREAMLDKFTASNEALMAENERLKAVANKAQEVLAHIGAIEKVTMLNHSIDGGKVLEQVGSELARALIASRAAKEKP